MHDYIAPEVRAFIRRDLEEQGYEIEQPAVRGLTLASRRDARPLSEGMTYRDAEPIMAIMKARDCFLVITAAHGGREGAPYLFGFAEASE